MVPKWAPTLNPSRALTQVAVDHSSRTHRLLVDHGMKVLQQLAYPVRSQTLAERGEPRQVNENHRRILAHRLLEETGVPGQPLPNIRRLKLCEQFASYGEILSAPPARP